jgi:hypothetical protein
MWHHLEKKQQELSIKQALLQSRRRQNQLEMYPFQVVNSKVQQQSKLIKENPDTERRKTKAKGRSCKTKTTASETLAGMFILCCIFYRIYEILYLSIRRRCILPLRISVRKNVLSYLCC